MKRFFVMLAFAWVCVGACVCLTACGGDEEDLDVNIVATHNIGKPKNGKYPVTFTVKITGCAKSDVDELCLYAKRSGPYGGIPVSHATSYTKTISNFTYKSSCSYYATAKVRGVRYSTSTKSFTVK